MNTVMKDFTFSTVPEIIVEWAGASRAGEIIQPRFSARRVLLVTDPGLVKAGILPPVLHSLQAAGFQVTVYDRVQPDPQERLVREALQVARDGHCDMVIGLGGGSSLDVAKLVAVLIHSEQDLQALYGIGKVSGQRLPLINIPTTAGTGSEVTNISILTTNDDSKMGIVAPQLYGDLVLLDAQLTLGLPPVHTAAAGIDAMVHAIEAYTGKHKKNPISDALAREALRLISRHLVTACRDGHNREARESVLLGAMLAGQAFANSPVGAVHALAYPLGARHHIPHGLSNALMLIPVLQFNAPVAAPYYAELAAVIGEEVSGDTEKDAAVFIAAMVRIIAESGAPKRLRDVDIPAETLAILAQDAMQQTRLLDNNPVPLTADDALRLYQHAF
ncbi:iron-containing alcohol dehydrogenase [Citrobacter sp. Awk 2]|uniref:iron-containing alcohol dehydrogenase n=1 Tax=Citrobacter sp. Awk 2 TaxID=2963959 RepID=UPI002303E439|nr:iron-containing alcohol dehydrogenase [Citrobacter sp. Awk 2]MDA8502510.1 iron-containing alcohol dehydrogenase [Citrobacter sp. Awk 2]